MSRRAERAFEVLFGVSAIVAIVAGVVMDSTITGTWGLAALAMSKASQARAVQIKNGDGE